MDWFVYILARLFFAMNRRLPRRLARFQCRLLAGLVHGFDSKHRRIGMVNLELAFPERDDRWRRKVLRRSFLQLGDLAVELGRMGSATSDDVRSRVDYQPGFGLEHYLEARSQGKGVLFLTAHIGVWELLPVAHAFHGHPLSFLVRSLGNRRLERWLSGLRSASGNELIDKRGGLRQVLRRLKEGRDVGFLIDQNVQEKDGVYAPLFGRPACTSSALASIALKTGAPVVAGFILPTDEQGRYLIRFHPPMNFQSGPDPGQDLIAATTRFNELIEATIREYPECWLWGHRRFQTQPDKRNLYG